MKDLEKSRARTDAIEDSKCQRASSASRNRFWAGLNRYLETEREPEHKAAKRGQEKAPREVRPRSKE